MKTLRYIIVACLLMAAMQFVSCHKDTYPESFAPSIKTGTYSDVYRKGATIYGNISMEDFQIESFGVEYTILTRPGLSIEQYFATAQQVPVDAVDEDGNFSVALENLDPGIIYLYRSYVNSGYTTVYGVDSSFQTPQNTEPVFGEVSIDGITYTSFDISAALADDGGGTIEQMAYIYKEVSDGEKGELTTSTPDIQTLHVKQEEGEQQYTAQIKNLRSGKTYAIRPYAVAHGMGYGDVKYVTTKVSNGTLISECDTSDVGIGSVRLQASILAHNSQYTVSRVGFCYSQESTEPTVEHLLLTAMRTGDNFEAVMNNLVLDADYYIRAYAKQSDGEYIYGDVLHYTHAMPADATFLSECEVQEVMVEDYDLILELRASVLHESSTYPIKELGFCYSTESREPTVNNLNLRASTSDSVQFYADTWGMGVDPDKSYYIRAYAKQSNDEYVYGPVRYWRTGMPPVTYILSFDGNGNDGWMGDLMDDQIFEAGLWQEISPNLYERSGYEFAGWNTARDGSGLSYADKQEILLTSDLTLYAQWQRISGTENGHEYVDLGLPSGTLWAACNVGASAPHDYGNYYAWGETSTKSNYDWSTYKYGTEKALTKYASDGKTSLDAEDDAARVNMGGRWCMPSLTQLEELRTHCSWTWASQSGVNGYIVTSNANGNSIFLPAAGDRNGTQGNFAASYGYYWSRSLAADASLNAANAEYLYFLAGSVGTYANHRSYGHAIRAVICEKAELTFDANGGEGTMASQLFEVGVAQAIEANAFTRDGYLFAGWNTAPDGSGTAYSDGQEITLSDNLTLYAQWKATQVVSGTENGHDYVDLGLPSGTKWATCNIGATTPEGYGDYFAYGEIAPKSNYSWETYKYGTSSNALTKYNTDQGYGVVDNKTNLELSDDAARVNMGGKWRMPNKNNQDELRTNCIWTWITHNGVNGFKVTSKVNGNSIFLPAGGWARGNSFLDVDNGGHYWLSTLMVNDPNAAYNIDIDADGKYWDDYGNRTDGHNIRAVFSDSDTPSEFVSVTFNANDGIGTMPAQTFEAGVSQVITKNTFTRDGYTFTGWNTSPDGSGMAYTDQQEITIDQNITLYAQWKKDIVYYSVTFNANGGEGTMSAQIFEAGVAQTLNENTFTRLDYTFTGWNTAANGRGMSYSDKQGITLTNDITLYAQWTTDVELEYAQVDVNAAGIVDGGSSLSAGTVLAETPSIVMTVGSDDTYRLSSAAVNGMTKIRIGSSVLDLAVACQGATNPKDAAGGNCDAYATAPASGAFVRFDAKNDGYLYVVCVGRSNKTYLVSEEYTLIGYDFAMHTSEQAWGTILSYTLKGEGEYNYITKDMEAAKNLIWPEKLALDVDKWTEITDAMVAAGAANAQIAVRGVAVIKFPVFEGLRYTVNSCGSKIITSGFFFGSKDENVVLFDEAGKEVVLY